MKFLSAEWPAPTHIRAYTTVRGGWIGPVNGEDKSEHDQQLISLLQLPGEPLWVNQIAHSAIALEATPANKEQLADATYTHQANHVCAVLTADCLPVLICNTQGTHVAAIHAGWRGLAAGIIESTLQGLNQDPQDLLVWLGPAIGPNKFEVGLDVFQAFTDKHPESAPAFLPHVKDKWLANLYELARIRLKKQGVTHIFGGNFCTYSQDDLFFSYRRDKGRAGSMASVIWINNNR